MKVAGTGYAGNDSNPPEANSFLYNVEGRKLTKVEPGQHREYQVFAANNDGTELWLGYGDRWKYWLSGVEVRALFWWLLWEWYAKARWFGLRRPIYYWALRRSLRKYRTQPQKHNHIVFDEWVQKEDIDLLPWQRRVLEAIRTGKPMYIKRGRNYGG